MVDGLETHHTAALVLGIGAAIVLLAAGAASADMHGACDTSREEAEVGAAGPAAYANVALYRTYEPSGGYEADLGFRYAGGVYCPGAAITVESLTLTHVGSGGVVAGTAAGDCQSSPAEACTVVDDVAGSEMDPGVYEVEMVYDADDPNTPGLEYNDTVRRQEFAWFGAGAPVVTCPDVGWVHANPPTCPRT